MVLTKVWEVYKDNWKLYLKLILVLALVLGLIKAGIVYLSFSFARMDSNANKDLMKVILIMANLVWWLGHLFWLTPLIYALDAKNAEEKVNLKKALGSILNNWHRTAVLAGIITGIYMIYLIPTYFSVGSAFLSFLLIATVFILVWYALFIPVWLLENRPLGEALAFSRNLLKGKRLSFALELMAIYIVITVFTFLLNFIIGWPLQSLAALNIISMNIALYFIVIFSTLTRIILASIVLVWVYCYYQDLKGKILLVENVVEG